MKNRTELRRALQSILISLGYDVGPTGADGLMGPDTARALRQASGCWPRPPRHSSACTHRNAGPLLHRHSVYWCPDCDSLRHWDCPWPRGESRSPKADDSEALELAHLALDDASVRERLGRRWWNLLSGAPKEKPTRSEGQRAIDSNLERKRQRMVEAERRAGGQDMKRRVLELMREVYGEEDIGPLIRSVEVLCPDPTEGGS